MSIRPCTEAGMRVQEVGTWASSLPIGSAFSNRKQSHQLGENGEEREQAAAGRL